MKRITILAGHYGSGKSEISVNLAINNNIDYIVDLDIINPYFRSRALNELFEEKGIHLVESTIKGMLNSDMPYVSGEAAVPFVQTDVTAIYDLGGTANGGRVLIQFVHRIKDLENIKGDIVQDYKTIPVTYGEHFTKILITLLIFLTMNPVYFLWEYPEIGMMKYYFYFVGLVFILFVIFLWKANTKKDYIILHNTIKLIIVVGVLSLMLIDTSVIIQRIINV